MLNCRQLLQGLGAGLVAAKERMSRGIPVLVLETRDNIGGRAFTDSSLGVSWARGCSWLPGRA